SVFVFRSGTFAFRQVSTHVLEDHADEVLCCRFSNGGGMLATSSADGVLILWDVGSGNV
ncbi:unnamed protein product, partial [Hapterophycus canaliculatus]